MNKFNLTFNGEIVTGQDPAAVKLRFAKMFEIDSPERVERFFSGDTIILRRNLERKEAAQYFLDLKAVGVVATLAKVTTSDVVDTLTGSKSTSASKAKQKAAEAAQRETERLEAERLAAETAAKREAEAARAKRDAEEKAAALLAAERAAKAKQDAEAAARKEERKQRAAERAAKRKAKKAEEKAERVRKKAAEAAKLRAELEAQRQREAEEAARRAEERAAQEEAAQAAKEQAELEQRKTQAAEAAARQKAEEAARLQAEVEEIRRQEVAAAARIKAEAQRKLAAAQRQSEERSRLAATKATPTERVTGAGSPPGKSAPSAKKPTKSQQRKKKQSKQRKAEQRKAALRQQEQTAQREALEEQAIQRAAQELSQQTALKPAKARVKTNLHIPVRKRGAAATAGGSAARKRQAGEPNLYALHPFRNTAEVRTRADTARGNRRTAYSLGFIALALLVLAGFVYALQPAPTDFRSITAIASAPQAGPILLAGDSLYLHDRAGVSTRAITFEELGVSELEPPLLVGEPGELFAQGRLRASESSPDSTDSVFLLRCTLEAPDCQPVSPALADTRIDAIVSNPINGNLILADNAGGELLKLSRNGDLLARRNIEIPSLPVLRLHSGLLLMNSPASPGIRVFRYEDSAFGKQLDEILLLPPPALAAGQSRVGDFLWSGESWLASLQNPDSGSIGLYRFDGDWNYIDAISLPDTSGHVQLSGWGEKTLVNDHRSLPLQRLNAQGQREAPFLSTLLTQHKATQERNTMIGAVAWRTGLLSLGLMAVAGFAFGYLQSLRVLVYKSNRAHGAEPVDDNAQAIHWIDPVPNRARALRQRNLTYGALVLGTLLLAIGQSVGVAQLIAMLIALSGPAIALQLLSRQQLGNIGVMDDKLVLVDHAGMYHIGSDSNVQYRGRFVMIDDVAVFVGNRPLPAFSIAQLQEQIRPLVMGTVKVDRKTLAVKLLQSGHPLAQGAVAIVASFVIALTVLALQVVG